MADANSQEPAVIDHLTTEEAPSLVTGAERSGLLTGGDGKALPAEFHPLAQLFPLIEGAAFAALVEDVKANGVHRPVVMHEGKILDGRNRYLAAREAGVGFPVAEFTGDDPVAYVVSENLHRRHLTESQRAMVSGKIAQLKRGRPEKPANLPVIAPTQAEAAQLMNVSERSVRDAKAVLDHGAAGLPEMVEQDQVSVSAAATVARLPEPEQAEIVAQGPEAVKAAAKEIRSPKTTTPKEKRPANGLSGLTREALEDEVLGLREENGELRQKLAASNAERDDLKARLTEATADNQGAVIGKLQKQLQAAKFARDEALAATKREEYRRKKAEARVKELEALPVDMGAL